MVLLIKTVDFINRRLGLMWSVVQMMSMTSTSISGSIDHEFHVCMMFPAQDHGNKKRTQSFIYLSRLESMGNIVVSLLSVLLF